MKDRVQQGSIFHVYRYEFKGGVNDFDGGPKESDLWFSNESIDNCAAIINAEKANLTHNSQRLWLRRMRGWNVELCMGLPTYLCETEVKYIKSCLKCASHEPGWSQNKTTLPGKYKKAVATGRREVRL